MSEVEVSSGADSGYEVGEPQANQKRVWLSDVGPLTVSRDVPLGFTNN
jgi:hypothetical protein